MLAFQIRLVFAAQFCEITLVNLSLRHFVSQNPVGGHDPMFDELNALDLPDFRIDSHRTAPDLGDDVLTVIGSTDFTYYHKAQVQFFNTVYLSCPAE